MKNLEIEKFTQILLKGFSAFVDEMKPDNLQPYMLFGDFGIYIRNLIARGNYDENELDKIFGFLNKQSALYRLIYPDGSSVIGAANQ